MRLSGLFPKTLKEFPKDESSINARFLIKAGFISKEVSGVYNYLPLGLKVLNKITNIVREKMNNSGGQEILLAALQNKENWERTGRWEAFDALFKLKSRYDTQYALGPTHEEVLVPIAKEAISSYKDLPIYLYQIQTKFRDEPRAKAGLLRGREFLMKDLYSFHSDEKDMESYYETMKGSYKKIFKRAGLEAIETKADGGTFSEYSHEYQVITSDGEDEIIYCPGGDFSENAQIAKVAAGKMCDLGHGPLKRVRTIEVGNIFPLKDKFSRAFNLTFKDKGGSEKLVIMGCYGIGISRLLGAIVEVHHDPKGIIWPESVAPFSVYLLAIGEQKAVTNKAEEIYEKLNKKGVEVLYDDRDESPGVKLADADLLGIPERWVVSEKTVQKDSVEIKKRNEKTPKLIKTSSV